MSELIKYITSINLVSILIALLIIASVIQGIRQGATGSAKRFASLLAEGVVTIVSIIVAWRLADWLSPQLQAWLTTKNIQLPEEHIGVIKQAYYTLVTAIRDFPLLRIGLIFLFSYAALKQLLYMVCYGIFGLSRWQTMRTENSSGRFSIISSAAGGVIGSAIGLGRALLIVAVLFVYTTLFPQAPFTGYIQASGLYQKGAIQIIEPFTGDFIDNQLPVFTRAVEEEFAKILTRKYEVLDARIPEDIAQAAKEITKGSQTDEEKARALYKWVGTRVVYDWDKVKLYEEQRIWKEQTPEHTFASKKGVCIDYSRLYAVMARAVELDVKVVTGLGYDGRGGYGPHAWNEVYVSELNKWVPLDSTWVASGGNWFNPPNFDKTHIKDA